MDLLIVRHAEPVRAARGNGPADPDLAQVGGLQAAALARWFARNPAKTPDRVISSPMRRAWQTALPIGEACGLEVEPEPRLAEFDLGAAEYVPLEMVGPALRRQLSSALETGQWGAHRFDPADFRARVLAGFRDITADSTASRVVVVCHGGVINAYLSAVLERPHTVFFEPRYTSVSRVLIDDEGNPHVRSLNELPHLEGRGASRAGKSA